MGFRSRTARIAGRLAAVLLAIVACVVGTGSTGSGSVESAVIGAPALTSYHTAFRPIRKGPFVVIVVVDAARFDQVDPSLMPNLGSLIQAGTEYTRAWVGQLPSITETSHATIGTGVLPSRHLILGDTWRIPGKNQMAPSLLSGQLDRTGYIGKFIQSTRVPSLASLVHTSYPGSIVVAVSGHKVYAADALGSGVADYVAFGGLDSRGHYVPGAIPGHVPGPSIMMSKQLDLPSYPRRPGLEDGWTTTLAEKFLFKYHPRLLMVNLPEVDVAGHAAGTDATVMQPLMQGVDRQIGRLVAAYRRAGLLPQTTFVITSDHAMVPGVHALGSKRINAVIQKAGGQALYVGHGDFCEIYLKNLAAVPRVAVALASGNLPHVAAVYQKQINGTYGLVSDPARLAYPNVNGSYLHLLATFKSDESADIVLMYDENTITMTPLYLKINRKGDHGGATWGAQHIPLIISGPGIKQGYSSTYPARLVDIAPTVETLLGIHPRGQDGIPLADAMTSPPVWARQAQTAVEGSLSADVTGLEREAQYRPNSH